MQVPSVCRIIGAINVELGPKPERCFDGDLDQVGGVLGGLPGAALGIGAGNIEVAQNDVTEIMSRCGVAEHDFRHQLGPAIGRDRCSQRRLGNRHLRWIAIDRCSR